MKKTIIIRKTDWVEGLGFTTWEDKVNYKNLKSKLEKIAKEELPFNYKSNWINDRGFLVLDIENKNNKNPMNARVIKKITDGITRLVEQKEATDFISKTNSNIWL